MQRQYREVGGALEHYQIVVKKNPFFPMARYFIGNVYNDWGSTYHNRSVGAKNQGNLEMAKSLRVQAEETWGKALATYDKVKAFAPNYVQTHHQVGLVHLKTGEMLRAWGEKEAAEAAWDRAMKNFFMYRNLDPVWPQNHYRMAYIHYTRGEYDLAEEAYLTALSRNSDNIVQRIRPRRNAETCVNLGRLYYIQLVNKYPNQQVLPREAEEFKKSVSYYQQGADWARKWSKDEAKYYFENKKGLAILYSRANMRNEAIPVWQELHQMRPDDPDVKSVFRKSG